MFCLLNSLPTHLSRLYQNGLIYHMKNNNLRRKNEKYLNIEHKHVYFKEMFPLYTEYLKCLAIFFSLNQFETRFFKILLLDKCA